MAQKKYLDNIGLAYFWNKLKNIFNSKEDSSNKVTTLSSSSTDTQYPSAKCVYDIVGDISSALDSINGEVVS